MSPETEASSVLNLNESLNEPPTRFSNDEKLRTPALPESTPLMVQAVLTFRPTTVSAEDPEPITLSKPLKDATPLTEPAARFTTAELVNTEKSNTSMPVPPFTIPNPVAASVELKVSPNVPPVRFSMLSNDVPLTSPDLTPVRFQRLAVLKAVSISTPSLP